MLLASMDSQGLMEAIINSNFWIKALLKKKKKKGKAKKKETCVSSYPP